MRHFLRLFKTFKLGTAVPQAGAGLLTSSVTLASVLWVSVTLPNMPLLHAFDSQNGTSVSISLQSALLGIDDGNARSLRDARALARSLGLTYADALPTPAELRAFTDSPTPSAPTVAQLNVLALTASTSTPPTTEPASQQSDVTLPIAPPLAPTPPVPTHALTPTVAPEPKSSPPVATPPVPHPQPTAPGAPAPPTPVPPDHNRPPTTPANPPVPDTTGPVIDAHANVVIEATGPAGAAVSYSLPTALDSVDGSVAVTCLPASGTTFALGHTTVTCSAQDAAHNSSTSTFDVNVRDTTSPTIQTHANVIAEATGPAGTAVTYTAPTASDLVDPSVSATCAPASGTTFALGHTTVTCSAQDAAHNTSTQSFDVNVRDTTGPTIQTHADIVAEATGAGGATITYTPPTAADAVSGATTVTCLPALGTTFALGHTTVTCSAQDAAHNASSSTFDVQVRDTTGPVIHPDPDVVVEATGPGGRRGVLLAPDSAGLG